MTDNANHYTVQAPTQIGFFAVATIELQLTGKICVMKGG